MPKSIVVTRTPLRISLAGGGTDLPSFYESEPGAVVSSTINKYIYVVVKRRYDDEIHVVYTKKEIVSRPEDIQHDLIREAMLLTASGTGLDVITTSDIPSEGSGLGSSSAVTVGVLHGLYAIAGFAASPVTLAQQACEIEINRLGRPIGKQDQFAAAFGGLRKYTFQPDKTVEIETVSPIGDSLGKSLHLFYTNKTRKSEDILTRQNQYADSNRLILQEMKLQAEHTWDSIVNNHYENIGTFLHKSWLKKQLLAPGISNPEIDDMYARAREAGATGGKICGAGGGGFLLLSVKDENIDTVRAALCDNRELPFEICTPGSQVILSM